MAKQEVKQNKIEELKQEIDKWVEEFKQSSKKFDRFDLFEGEQLSLGFLSYKNEKGDVTVLISIHGQKPSNSVSFPISALEDIKQITKLIEKYEEVFRYIEKYETEITTKRKKKNLLE